MKTIKNFFKQYTALSFSGDSKQLADMYGHTFIAAGPKELLQFNNDQHFLKWLDEVHQFNKESGMKEMEAARIETTPIGEFYSSALVSWSVVYEKKPTDPILFEITYILQHHDQTYKIIMFISHEDQQQLMKKNKLL